VPLGDQPALAWSLRNGGLQDWATGVGPATFLIIDEAGMANTLSLDAAVEFAIDHAASVRLIGDDSTIRRHRSRRRPQRHQTDTRRPAAYRAAPLHQPACPAIVVWSANEPAHAEKAADAAEEQSPWRAANGAREAEPQAKKRQRPPAVGKVVTNQ
jgi:hypothetical protein